jgi:hypothetical protein
MSRCPTGRLFSPCVSARRRNHRRRARETGRAGIGGEFRHDNGGSVRFQSLPGLFPADPSLLSLLIPSDFLLPTAIEMPELLT